MAGHFRLVEDNPTDVECKVLKRGRGKRDECEEQMADKVETMERHLYADHPDEYASYLKERGDPPMVVRQG